MIKISDTDIHPHLKLRMEQRGISRGEIEMTLNEGWIAKDAKPGTLGKLFVFPYNKIWEGKLFEEKEVCVYYKIVNDSIVLLTAKARYGKDFLKERGSNEVRV